MPYQWDQVRDGDYAGYGGNYDDYGAAQVPDSMGMYGGSGGGGGGGVGMGMGGQYGMGMQDAASTSASSVAATISQQTRVAPSLSAHATTRYHPTSPAFALQNPPYVSPSAHFQQQMYNLQAVSSYTSSAPSPQTSGYAPQYYSPQPPVSVSMQGRSPSLSSYQQMPRQNVPAAALSYPPPGQSPQMQQQQQRQLQRNDFSVSAHHATSQLQRPPSSHQAPHASHLSSPLAALNGSRTLSHPEVIIPITNRSGQQRPPSQSQSQQLQSQQLQSHQQQHASPVIPQVSQVPQKQQYRPQNQQYQPSPQLSYQYQLQQQQNSQQSAHRSPQMVNTSQTQSPPMGQLYSRTTPQQPVQPQQPFYMSQQPARKPQQTSPRPQQPPQRLQQPAQRPQPQQHQPSPAQRPQSQQYQHSPAQRPQSQQYQHSPAQRPQSQQHQPPPARPQEPESRPQHLPHSPSISQHPAPRPPQSIPKPVNVPQTPHDASPSQRFMARVEIPAFQSSQSYQQVEEEIRSPKRRRSNDGNAVDIKPPPIVYQPEPAPILSVNPMDLMLAKPAPPVVAPPKPNIDLQAVLLGLADEYLKAAYGMTSPVMTDEQTEEYHKLLATAMGCLQSALINFRDPDPRKEARVRLKIATLLVDETDNNIEAEEFLSKGIALCDRHRLSDIKYTMHYALIRQEFKSSPKRAFKAISTIVQEVEALRLVNWIYAFRFLRVSLSMQLDIRADVAAMLKQLEAISVEAESHKHVSVQIFAAAIEALLHLVTGASEGIDLAQSALATARSHQLGPEMQAMPQLQILLAYVDLGCCLSKPNPDQATAKMQQLHQLLDNVTKNPTWGNDGSFALPTGSSSNNDLHLDTCGIMRRMDQDKVGLNLHWISLNELYAVGYLLSSLACMYMKTGKQKAVDFLADGRKVIDMPLPSASLSLSTILTQSKQHTRLQIAVRLQSIFLHCWHADWDAAKNESDIFHQHLTNAGCTLDEPNLTLFTYYTALSFHGLGDLPRALEIYSTPILLFRPETKNPAIKDLQALATLNSILILRSRSPSEATRADTLLATLKPYCLTNHPDPSLAAAVQILMVSVENITEESILKTKSVMHHGIRLSRDAHNPQLLCILMNLLSSTFFTKLVGDQADRSFATGRALARNGQERLWEAVADGMLVDNAVRSGRTQEAVAAQAQGFDALMRLPLLVRREFGAVLEGDGPA